MASQLLTRVQKLINPRVARDVNSLEGTGNNPDVPPHPNGYLFDQSTTPSLNTAAHWPAGSFGRVLEGPVSVTIHGTSGWASYASALGSGTRFKSLSEEWTWLSRAQPPQWSDSRGVGPQYTIDANGTIFPLVGPEDLDGDIRTTWHNEAMNVYSIGIEQTDFGDSGIVIDAPGSTRLRRLNQAPNVTPNTADLAGMKVYAQVHPGGDEDLNLIWIALSTYTGPGDITSTHFGGWRNSLFTERDYRSLATLCRFLAEDQLIARNFPTLPYAARDSDSGNAAIFRQLLLGDPTCDQIAGRLGLDVAVARAGGTAWTTAYAVAPLRFWKGFFGLPTVNGHAFTPCFEGFISHMINGGHPCPGPYFDWHRFAREVWDWWWYPFDFAGTPLQPSTGLRAYRRARGDTRLIDYYFDAVGSTEDYASRITVQTTPPFTVTSRFDLAAQVPIHSLANGVLVAGRLPVESGQVGFLLTRHEVFTPDRSGPLAGRITFNSPPTTVWSLIRYLSAPEFTIDQIGLWNPDWLNRLVIRLTECELAVAYHNSHSTDAALTRAWRHVPIPPDPQAPQTTIPTVGEQIERDARTYRELVNDLTAGRAVLFPREVAGSATTVRSILGDFIGFPDLTAAGTPGIQVEIFSKVQLAGPNGVFGTVSAIGEDWWASATAAARHEESAAQDLPPDGLVWTYPIITFLQWINTITWQHEWSKYGVLDFSRSPPVPVPAPARPNSRTSF
jgi:hypothetical protein